MRRAPLRPEFGPTLPELVVPRWRGLSRVGRVGVLALAVATLVCAAGLAAFWPRRGHYTHDPAPRFSFDYPRELKRVRPGPGQVIKLEQRRHGQLLQSLAIEPLMLPVYRGLPEGELPVFSSGYERRLSAALPGFIFLGEGKTRVNGIPSYYVLYQFGRPGQPIFAHDNLIVPDQIGSRAGVIIELRATPSARVRAAAGVGLVGPLADAQQNFQLGS